MQVLETVPVFLYLNMIVSKAKEFALKAHSGQKYGTRDYSFHLEAVVKVARDFSLNENIISACWLHDTMEDCKVSYSEIKSICGEEVAEMVYCVTDELGRNRKERKEKTYPKIAANENALCVKLCDRIANLQQSILDKNTGLLSMYLKEHAEFKNKLYIDNPVPAPLWKKLEELIEEGKNLN
jgi:(p)ppGpp synthase/HD superfamily hydrolase